MAKKIVRYLLEGDGTTPLFVEIPGYFLIGEDRVGLSVDESIRHIPTSVLRLTRAELLTRVQNSRKVDGVYINDAMDVAYTDERCQTEMEAFLEMCGLPDYA